MNMQIQLKRMLLEFLSELNDDDWYGKERELVSRFAFSKLVNNFGCCKEFYNAAQIGIEVRVKQVTNGKQAVCKDLVIFKRPNQNYWSEDNVPLCIMEWKFGYKKPSQYDIIWLKRYTRKYAECFGIAINIRKEETFQMHAILIENGKIIKDLCD